MLLACKGGEHFSFRPSIKMPLARPNNGGGVLIEGLEV
jgi:hypothetical protein